MVLVSQIVIEAGHRFLTFALANSGDPAKTETQRKSPTARGNAVKAVGAGLDAVEVHKEG